MKTIPQEIIELLSVKPRTTEELCLHFYNEYNRKTATAMYVHIHRAKQITEVHTEQAILRKGRGGSGATYHITEKASKELSRAEWRVVDVILDGNTTLAEASQVLGLTPRSIQTHLYNIYPKIGVKNKCELILKMMEGRKTDAKRRTN